MWLGREITWENQEKQWGLGNGGVSGALGLLKLWLGRHKTSFFKIYVPAGSKSDTEIFQKYSLPLEKVYSYL